MPTPVVALDEKRRPANPPRRASRTSSIITLPRRVQLWSAPAHLFKGGCFYFCCANTSNCHSTLTVDGLCW